MTEVAQMVINTATSQFTYVAVEHWATLKEGQPPELVYMFVTTFKEAFTVTEAMGNSKWVELFSRPNGVDILVRITAVCTTRREATNIVVRRLMEMSPRPICNAQGYTLAGRARMIIAEDGRKWRTQAEAGEALGVSQSTINAALTGRAKAARGVRLTYGVMV